MIVRFCRSTPTHRIGFACADRSFWRTVRGGVTCVCKEKAK